MRYLMNLINLKNISAAVTAIGIAVCLVPQSAQAGFFRYSGTPNAGGSFFAFILNTSVSNSSSNTNEGLFEGAIQDAIYRCVQPAAASFCGSGRSEIFFQPGDLKVSRITEPNFPGPIGGIKYEARLIGTNPSDFVDFGFFVSADTPSSFINSLSELDNLLNTNRTSLNLGVSSPNSESVNLVLAFGSFSSISVPEPNTTASLLGVSLSGLLLLKRNHRLIKVAQNRLTVSK